MGRQDETLECVAARVPAPVGRSRSAPVVPIRVAHTRRRRTVEPTVSVVLPARDEAPNLPWLFAHLPAMVDEVVLVDGASRDGTPDVARHLRPEVRIVDEPAPGKGVAVAAGLQTASCDVVVMLDADCSMDPGEIPAFVGALVAGADVAKGSRYLAGAGSGDLTATRNAGNRSLTRLVNLLYGQRWTELCYGYAAMWRDLVPSLVTDELRTPDPTLGTGDRPRFGHGFEIEAVLFCRAAQAGLRVVEVASIERPRKYGASSLRPLRDGSRVLRAVLRERHGTRAATDEAVR